MHDRKKLAPLGPFEILALSASKDPLRSAAEMLAGRNPLALSSKWFRPVILSTAHALCKRGKRREGAAVITRHIEELITDSFLERLEARSWVTKFFQSVVKNSDSK